MDKRTTYVDIVIFIRAIEWVFFTEEWIMNIVLRRFLHNHGNIATEGSPKPGFQGFYIVYNTIGITVHYVPLNSLEHCKAQPRWQITIPTGIRTWYPQVTSPSRHKWAIGAGLFTEEGYHRSYCKVIIIHLTPSYVFLLLCAFICELLPQFHCRREWKLHTKSIDYSWSNITWKPWTSCYLLNIYLKYTKVNCLVLLISFKAGTADETYSNLLKKDISRN